METQEPSFYDKVGTARPSAHSLRTERCDEATATANDGRPEFRASSAWAESDGEFWGTPSSHQTLPPDIYRMELRNNIGPVFLRQSNDTDALLALPDSESARILDEIRTFKGLRAKFREHGFLYKRGILLWGPPGSGKTATLQLVVKLLREEHESVAVLVEHPKTASVCLQQLRRIEPDRQIVAIMEDLDALCERYDEAAYLALLDGEAQVDNIIWLATTNYPERLDKRFVDRPSRFDTVRYVGMPCAASRATYLRSKLPSMEDREIDEYVRLSDGYSIAHLRELIVLTQCFEVPLAAAIKRLNVTRRNPPASDRAPDRIAVGFTS